MNSPKNISLFSPKKSVSVSKVPATFSKQSIPTFVLNNSKLLNKRNFSSYSESGIEFQKQNSCSISNDKYSSIRTERPFYLGEGFNLKDNNRKNEYAELHEFSTDSDFSNSNIEFSKGVIEVRAFTSTQPNLFNVDFEDKY